MEFPTSDPDWFARRQRDDVLSHLVARGNWNAVQALENIRELVLDESPNFDVYIHRARELARSRSNTKWSPQQLMQLFPETDKRLIRSSAGLASVILEQLQTIQNKLQGQSPLAAAFWNQRGVVEPKDEVDAVGILRSFLVDQLETLGITLDLETENRRDDKPDLFFQYRNEDIGAIVKIPGEVKCCYNAQVLSGMKHQLADRYMIDGMFLHGVYVVLWFHSAAWDASQSRARHSISHSEDFDEFRDELANRSLQLTTEGKTIHSFVLDCSLPLSGRK